MITPDYSLVVAALHQSWSAETAYRASDWTPANPARGQCAVSVLVVQHLLGGELMRYAVTGDMSEVHHVNCLPGNVVVDTTSLQYDAYEVTLTRLQTELKGHVTARAKYLSDPDIARRYELLLGRVEARLASAADGHTVLSRNQAGIVHR